MDSSSSTQDKQLQMDNLYIIEHPEIKLKMKLIKANKKHHNLKSLEIHWGFLVTKHMKVSVIW